MSDKIYKVKNRSASVVGYVIPEAGIRRSFTPGEIKNISDKELEQLMFQPGGPNLLQTFLQVQSTEALQEMGLRVEPEYHMSEADVIELIKNGSLDAFKDALDFAPRGVVDLIKRLSVSVPLTDLSKRKALKEQTGFDVDAAIRHNEEDKEDEGTILKQTTRRVAPAEETAPAGRRTTPKYNVVNKSEANAE